MMFSSILIDIRISLIERNEVMGNVFKYPFTYANIINLSITY